MAFRLIGSLTAVLFLPLTIVAQEAASVVRRYPEAGLIIAPRTDGQAIKPIAIKNAEDLAKAIPDVMSQTVIKKGVDLEKEQIVYFHWFGPKADKLSFRVAEGRKVVVFRFTGAEKTKDLHEQIHIYVLPKEATWKVESVP